MRLDVFNTYARQSDGTRIHFDVLMPAGSDPALAKQKAIAWLESIGVNAVLVELESCEFCHVEEATPEYAGQVQHVGYAILQMEGCPSPIY